MRRKLEIYYLIITLFYINAIIIIRTIIMKFKYIRSPFSLRISKNIIVDCFSCFLLSMHGIEEVEEIIMVFF